jgi:hypothetical protein
MIHVNTTSMSDEEVCLYGAIICCIAAQVLLHDCFNIGGHHLKGYFGICHVFVITMSAKSSNLAGVPYLVINSLIQSSANKTFTNWS